MPLLVFKKCWAPAVESGEKRHTIRARRKNGKDPRAGQILYMWTGLRSKKSRKLREEVCTSSEPIQIEWDSVVVAGQLLDADQEEQLAIADGFDTLTDFREFFLKDHPKNESSGEQFDGYLIKW